MASWADILHEISTVVKKGGKAPFDEVRRSHLVRMHAMTGRHVVLYAASFTQTPSAADPRLVQIDEEDLQGLMSVLPASRAEAADLIIHSPGGRPESAEAIVSYLRSRFYHIRAVVPHLAMSAATMLACSCDEILMADHSFLGPIDPQFVLQTPLGIRMVPAQAILDQFEQAVCDGSDPARRHAWVPLLSQFGPDLLMQARNALAMSQDLVRDWLARYMFRHEPTSKRNAAARRTADRLADHNRFRSHARHLSREDAAGLGLRVSRLENQAGFYDEVMSVFHSTTLCFQSTSAVKIVENHLGQAFIRHAGSRVAGQQAGRSMPTTRKGPKTKP